MFWKRRKNKVDKFKCSNCGQVHSDWPALAFNSPTHFHYLSDEDKSKNCKLDEDFCEIHRNNQIDRFIRVTLFQKVNNSCKHLQYGLWVSLSEKSYLDYRENFNNQNHGTGYFGWLSSNVAEYENTLSIPCDVYTKLGNERPEIIPHEDFDHQFVRDYYNGISTNEAETRIQEMIKGFKN